MNRRKFLQVGLGTTVAAATAYFGLTTVSRKRPNLLIIHTDEHNFRTLGCYRKTLPKEQAFMWGPAVVETPHIDRLAKEGALCTKFYATTPCCSPSRASFMTGRYPQNTSVITNGIPLDNDSVTFAEILRRSGYATGYAGKWHLDGRENRPGWAPARKFGFEDNRFMYNKGHWKLLDIVDGKLVVGTKNGNLYYGAIGDEKTFSTDWLCDRTVEFIDSHKEQPFCFMVSIPDPHDPDFVRAPYDTMYADQEYTQPRSALNPDNELPKWGRKQNGDYNQSKYYGMVKCIDDNVGKIIQCLEQNELLDNTIVVFTSDHGDLRGEHHRHDKAIIYEASIKVPFVIRWPKKIKAGTIVPQVLDCTDFLPTILGLMDVPSAGKEDGRDASSLFTGEKIPADWKDMVFLRGTIGAGWIAAFTQRYKLTFSNSENPWLFDLETDPDEMVNQFHNPEYRKLIRSMTRELSEYAEKYNDSGVKNKRIAADIAWSISRENVHVSNVQPVPETGTIISE